MVAGKAIVDIITRSIHYMYVHPFEDGPQYIIQRVVVERVLLTLREEFPVINWSAGQLQDGVGTGITTL